MQKESSQQIVPASAQATPSPALSVPSAEPAVMNAPPKLPYSVQVGAYRHLENAEQQVARLTAKGYPAKLFEMSDSGTKPWYIAQIGDYPTVESARTMADEFSRREKMATFVLPK